MRRVTQLAVRMGKPGLELENPTALETPEDTPDEQARELKSKPRRISSMPSRLQNSYPT